MQRLVDFLAALPYRVDRQQGPPARAPRPRRQHGRRGVPAADARAAAGRPRDHPRRQQHGDGVSLLRQADGRVCRCSGISTTTRSGSTSSGSGGGFRTYGCTADELTGAIERAARRRRAARQARGNLSQGAGGPWNGEGRRPDRAPRPHGPPPRAVSGGHAVSRRAAALDPAWIGGQRWFAGKGRPIERIEQVAGIEAGGGALLLVDVHAGRAPERYAVPVGEGLWQGLLAMLAAGPHDGFELDRRAGRCPRARSGSSASTSRTRPTSSTSGSC